jgi:hypothetical protein
LGSDFTAPADPSLFLTTLSLNNANGRIHCNSKITKRGTKNAQSGIEQTQAKNPMQHQTKSNSLGVDTTFAVRDSLQNVHVS